MAYWVGIFLLVTGLLSLLLNELTVQIRRAWPWRRDDVDRDRDEALNDYYRYSVFVGSVVSIELGGLFAKVNMPHVLLRIAVYIIALGWLIWRQRRRNAAGS